MAASRRWAQPAARSVDYWSLRTPFPPVPVFSEDAVALFVGGADGLDGLEGPDARIPHGAHGLERRADAERSVERAALRHRVEMPDGEHRWT